MKQLSKIPMDEIILVGEDIESGSLVTKRDYLNDSFYHHKDVPIYQTSHTIMTFNWEYIIENLGEDERYDDWPGDVLYEIEKSPELQAAKEILDKIFANHPTYWQEGEILNDMIGGAI